MFRRRALAVSVCLAAAVAVATPGRGGETPSHLRAPGLKMQLVSGSASIRPGEPFFVGLFLRHDKGFHTYWKSPGLAGVPTQIDWTLPEGYQADPILWPMPDKVKMATINTHGYEKDAMLVVRMVPPDEQSSGPVTLTAKILWMCCADSCHPGHGTLSLTLPVSDEPPATTEWQAKIDAIRREQPPPAAGWKFTAVRDGKFIEFTAVPEAERDSPPGNLQFFSSDGLVCSHPVQSWKSSDDGTVTCRFAVSEFPPSDQTRLRGLLRGDGGWNPGSPARFVRLDIPLTTPTTRE